MYMCAPDSCRRSPPKKEKKEDVAGQRGKC